MNWDALGAVGEIIAAIGVIVTLAYLAVQIRSQTKEARLNATRELARDYRRLVEKVGDDPDLFATYIKALNDYDGLLDNERSRIHLSVLSPLFGIHEQMYMHLKEGSVDPVLLESIQNRLSEVTSRPGLRTWWKRNSDAYSPEYREYMDLQFARSRPAQNVAHDDVQSPPSA